MPRLVSDQVLVGDTGLYPMIGFREDEVDLADYNQGMDMAGFAAVSQRLAHRMPAMADSYFRGGWSGLFDDTPTGTLSWSGSPALRAYT